MVEVNLKYSEAQMEDLRNTLAAIPRGWQIAASRAINKTATTVRSKLVKAIAKVLPLSQKAIRDKVPLRKAHQRLLQATIRITGGRIPLKHFRARATKKGITYLYEGKRLLAKNAFWATMRTGHKGVFRRKKGSTGELVGRFPIEELYGPSILSAYFKDTNIINVEAPGLLEHYLSQQIDVILARYRSGVKL